MGGLVSESPAERPPALGEEEGGAGRWRRGCTGEDLVEQGEDLVVAATR